MLRIKTEDNVVSLLLPQKRTCARGCRGKYSLSRPHSGTKGTSVRSTRSSGALPRNPARRGRLCGEHSCAEGGKVIVPHSPCNPCSRGSVVPHSSPDPPPARRGRSPRPCTPGSHPRAWFNREPRRERRQARSLLAFGRTNSTLGGKRNFAVPGTNISSAQEANRPFCTGWTAQNAAPCMRSMYLA